MHKSSSSYLVSNHKRFCQNSIRLGLHDIFFYSPNIQRSIFWLFYLFTYSTPLEGLVQPRSSRLKDKVKSEGKEMVKKLFVDNLVINNHHINILLDGASCIVLPKSQTRLQPCRDDADDAYEESVWLIKAWSGKQNMNGAKMIWCKKGVHFPQS